MSKINDFFGKISTDDAKIQEIDKILGSKAIDEATDEQLAKLSDVAKKLDIDITAEEFKAFANGSMELDDEELDAVSGGWDEEGHPTQASEWFDLACEVEKGRKTERSIVAVFDRVAAEHNMSRKEVLDNWSYFKRRRLLENI